jgi:hypothetical protein
MTNALTQCAYRKSSPGILVMQFIRIGRHRMRPAASAARDISASRSGTLLRFRAASVVQGAGLSEARGPWRRRTTGKALRHRG